ncbi:hypothetical protein WFO77_12775 [Yersinia enterocolitica]
MKELDSFTVEQLNDFIKSDHTQCGDVAALARIALVAKRAEPVDEIAFDMARGIIALVNETNIGGACQLQAKIQCFIEEALTTTLQLNSPEIPEGWPTEDMVIAGFESGAWDALSSAVLKRQGWPYSCRESAECVTGIFKAMLAAAPEKPL